MAYVKLPTLSLSHFSGSAQERLDFSNLFCAAVLNNPKFFGAVKLQYLKGALKSDMPKIVVRSLPYNYWWISSCLVSSNWKVF